MNFFREFDISVDNKFHLFFRRQFHKAVFSFKSTDIWACLTWSNLPRYSGLTLGTSEFSLPQEYKAFKPILFFEPTRFPSTPPSHSSRYTPMPVVRKGVQSAVGHGAPPQQKQVRMSGKPVFRWRQYKSVPMPFSVAIHVRRAQQWGRRYDGYYALRDLSGRFKQPGDVTTQQHCLKERRINPTFFSGFFFCLFISSHLQAPVLFRTFVRIEKSSRHQKLNIFVSVKACSKFELRALTKKN